MNQIAVPKNGNIRTNPDQKHRVSISAEDRQIWDMAHMARIALSANPIIQYTLNPCVSVL